MYSFSKKKISIKESEIYDIFKTVFYDAMKEIKTIENYENVILPNKYIGKFNNIQNISSINLLLDNKTLKSDMLPLKLNKKLGSGYDISLVDFDNNNFVIRLEKEYGMGSRYQWIKKAYVDFALNRKGEYLTVINNKRLDIENKNCIQSKYNVINPSDFTHGKIKYEPSNNGIQFYTVHYFDEPSYKDENYHDTQEKITSSKLKKILNNALISFGVLSIDETTIE